MDISSSSNRLFVVVSSFVAVVSSEGERALIAYDFNGSDNDDRYVDGSSELVVASVIG